MAQSYQTQTVRILIAEDHEEARKTLVRLIGLQDGMEVVGQAANGVEAVKKAKILEPDVMLVDIRMPEMDGIEAITVLRSIKPDLKIIVLSAHEDETYVAEAIKHGADAYILKGLSMDTIVEAIREVIKGKIILSPDITAPLVKKYRQADAVLSGFYKSLYQSEGTPELIGKFLREILEYLEADSCSVFRGRRRGTEVSYELFNSVRQTGLSDELEADRIFQWLSARADDLIKDANRDEPLVLNEYEYMQTPGIDAGEKISLLIMPVLTWSSCSGWMISYRKQPFSSHAMDMLYLHAIVGQLGLILDNATLRTQIEQIELSSVKTEEYIGDVVLDNINNGGLEEALRIAALVVGAKGIFIGRLNADTGGYAPFAAWNIDMKSLESYLDLLESLKALDLISDGHCFSKSVGKDLDSEQTGPDHGSVLFVVPLSNLAEGEMIRVDALNDEAFSTMEADACIPDIDGTDAVVEGGGKVVGLMGFLFEGRSPQIFQHWHMISRVSASIADNLSK